MYSVTGSTKRDCLSGFDSLEAFMDVFPRHVRVAKGRVCNLQIY